MSKITMSPRSKGVFHRGHAGTSPPPHAIPSQRNASCPVHQESPDHRCDPPHAGILQKKTFHLLPAGLHHWKHVTRRKGDVINPVIPRIHKSDQRKNARCRAIHCDNQPLPHWKIPPQRQKKSRRYTKEKRRLIIRRHIPKIHRPPFGGKHQDHRKYEHPYQEQHIRPIPAPLPQSRLVNPGSHART